MNVERPMESIRLAGARMLMWLFWLNVPALMLIGWLLNSPDAEVGALAAALLALLPTIMVRRRDISAPARMTLAVTSVAIPALYVFLLRGHGWQMDMHMGFFAALAAQTVLLDRRALLVAAGVTALHHLILNYSYPAWVFASEGDLPRVLVHALIVVIQTLMLWWIVSLLTQTIRLQTEERQRSEGLRKEADAAKERAEVALAELERAQTIATRQRAIEEAARRAEEASERRRLVSTLR